MAGAARSHENRAIDTARPRQIASRFLERWCAVTGMNVSRDKAVAVEDTPDGVAAARDAGVPVMVARSSYFFDVAIDGAIAIGPGLLVAATGIGAGLSSFLVQALGDRVELAHQRQDRRRHGGGGAAGAAGCRPGRRGVAGRGLGRGPGGRPRGARARSRTARDRGREIKRFDRRRLPQQDAIVEPTRGDQESIG